MTALRADGDEPEVHYRIALYRRGKCVRALHRKRPRLGGPITAVLQHDSSAYVTIQRCWLVGCAYDESPIFPPLEDDVQL
jgi:hypothetical protein